MAIIAMNGIEFKNTTTHTEAKDDSLFLVQPIKDEPCRAVRTPHPMGATMPTPDASPAPSPTPAKGADQAVLKDDDEKTMSLIHSYDDIN